MSKFICVVCNKEHDVKVFSVVIVDNKKQYRQRGTTKPLICDCEGKGLLESIDVPIDYSEKHVSIGTFNSMTLEAKQDMLKKRSAAHFQREIKEKKHEMHKATVKQLLNK
jgi:hypothetical protein